MWADFEMRTVPLLGTSEWPDVVPYYNGNFGEQITTYYVNSGPGIDWFRVLVDDSYLNNGFIWCKFGYLYEISCTVTAGSSDITVAPITPFPGNIDPTSWDIADETVAGLYGSSCWFTPGQVIPAGTRCCVRLNLIRRTAVHDNDWGALLRIGPGSSEFLFELGSGQQPALVSTRVLVYSP